MSKDKEYRDYEVEREVDHEESFTREENISNEKTTTIESDPHTEKIEKVKNDESGGIRGKLRRVEAGDGLGKGNGKHQGYANNQLDRREAAEAASREGSDTLSGTGGGLPPLNKGGTPDEDESTGDTAGHQPGEMEQAAIDSANSNPNEKGESKGEGSDPQAPVDEKESNEKSEGNRENNEDASNENSNSDKNTGQPKTADNSNNDMPDRDINTQNNNNNKVKSAKDNSDLKDQMSKTGSEASKGSPKGSKGKSSGDDSGGESGGGMTDKLKNAGKNAVGKAASGAPGSEQVDKLKKTVKRTADGARRTGSLLAKLWGLIINPITWIVLGIFLVVIIIMSGSQIIGRSDFAKNCGAGGGSKTGELLPDDPMEAANVLGAWFMSNPQPGVYGDKILSKEQIAGMMGNAYAESEVKSTTIQTLSMYNPDEYKEWSNKRVMALGKTEQDGGRAFGIWQMDTGRRYAQAKWAEETGRQWWDTQLQLEWVGKEALEDPYEQSQLKKEFLDCKTVAQCTVAWRRDVERAGIAVDEKRIDFAEKFYKQFNGKGGTTFSGSGNAASCGADASSINTDDIAKMAIDIAWPPKDYSKGLVSPNGNGKGQAKPEYIKAKKEAEDKTGADPYPGGLWASCDRFVATVMRGTGKDTNFPWGPTSAIYNYLEKESKYQKINCSDRKPGDILITKGDGHTAIYVGNVEGKDSIASASYMERVGTINQDISCSGDAFNADGRTMYGYRLK